MNSPGLSELYRALGGRGYVLFGEVALVDFGKATPTDMEKLRDLINQLLETKTVKARG